MDPGLYRMSLMIMGYLARGVKWWNMPMVLVMVLSYFQREKLMQYNLFDTYPETLPSAKLRCNDPVLGNGYLGCYKYKALTGRIRGFSSKKKMTVKRCIKTCYRKRRPYAGISRGSRCNCFSDYPAQKSASECYCNRRTSGDTQTPGGGKKHVSLYKTNFCSVEMIRARTADGSCNDLHFPPMGSRYYRFGRNVPLNQTNQDRRLLQPNPRTISRRLMTRTDFKPARWLNMWAVAWIQFTLHDWFDHGLTDPEKDILVPLTRDDPMYHKYNGVMRVSRTTPNSCRQDPSKPTSYQNHVTHWWDGSQIYGSDKATQERLRSFVDGKLHVDDSGFLPVDPVTNIEITGFSSNWWVGLSLMHNAWTREHNKICTMLKRNNPRWNDQKLFDTARLITTALMAKIHTVEWTPAILNEKFVEDSVLVEWYGKLSNRVIKWLINNNITLQNGSINAHIGHPKDLRGVNFSLTEEFVAVYRMHPLLPDNIDILSMDTGTPTGRSYSLPQFSFGNAAKVFDNNNLEDIVFTFGKTNPGALVLHNYPKRLTNMELPGHQGGRFIDLATIDVLRDRERGIPRYNQFRRLLQMKPKASFRDLSDDPVVVDELKAIYNNDLESVDLLVGCLAESPRPPGFGFSETAFQVFVLMANRRLMTDRFLTDDYKAEYYTQAGLDWVRDSGMKQVLLRAFPEVDQLDEVLKSVTNVFKFWK